MSLQRPRAVSPDDNTAQFDSGEHSLDVYLQQRALANHIADYAKCRVSIDESGTVVGYYTLSAIAVERSDLPGRARRNAPDPIPAVLLGRLAVDRKAQGHGLGKALLRDAILTTLEASAQIGVRVLLVHALHAGAAAFYGAYGFKPSPTDPLHLYLLLADARLSLG